VNPRPCYGHDVGQVEEILGRLHEFAPLCAPVTVSVSRLEDLRGANGWAQQHWEYYDCFSPAACECDVMKTVDGEQTKKRSRNWDGVIVLSGRTTEIHPAIARYVTPHEYGHVLEDALGLVRCDNGGSDPGRELLREWAKARRIPDTQFELDYSVTSHHLMPGEIFANDFRFVFGAETEWWPHRDVVRPLGEPGTKKALAWWDDALGQLRDCYRTARAGT
jgi:hypothetical protein